MSQERRLYRTTMVCAVLTAIRHGFQGKVAPLLQVPVTLGTVGAALDPDAEPG